MQVKITDIKKKISKFGGYFYSVNFKDKSGYEYYTCLDPRKKNFIRWERIMKVGVILDNLKIYKGKLLNADSKFKVIKDFSC